MSDTTIREHLSALMDGELSREQAGFLLRRLGHDREAIACWTRLHTARDCLKGAAPRLAGPGFAARVSRALIGGALPARGRWLRWSAGGVIAATVAVTALLMVQPLPRSEPDMAAAAAPTPAPAWLNDPAAAVQPATAFAQAPVAIDDVQTAAYSPQLDAYTLRHYQSGDAAAAGGLVPYVLLMSPPQGPAPVRGGAAEQR
ncbi:MAG: sigma-E factor negative regulatory protein [Xanthomonadaceae bacterium]|nr:sigma-E factor negative regulatory protein [Xanthomonadaceae bacterium]MDE2177044.1 sigma-E factor negative regulatory protein [Xanthomonadaceae bacterium]MDE2245130.1 sigma-E factor negative regulatory protein [Xanthomonadaceae bacterium]